ncbi:MAG: putative Ig domain-containing protein [Flavobacteriales bacterium]|nr:putative Ig domain-containing protein [Flavobacteriales bacterium]
MKKNNQITRPIFHRSLNRLLWKGDQNLYSIPSQIKNFFILLFIGLLFFNPLDTMASHYRYGQISWQKINNSTNQVEFTITQGWRMSAFFSGTPALGTNTTATSSLVFGDGSTNAAIILKVTSVNAAEDWFVGEMKITHTYSTNGNFTAYFSSCCRIGTLQDGAANGSFRSSTIVNIGTTNNSPTSTIPAIISLQTGLSAAAFTIPGADPDGDTLRWRKANSGDILINPSPKFSVDSFGKATFNTTGLSIGALYVAAAVISDQTSNTMVDFIVKIVGQSTPPQFDYTVTPTNGFSYKVPPNTNISFNVKAFDTDNGATVSLSAVGVPIGATWSPGAAANPVTTAFSWTPTSTDLGSRIITFTAQDDNGVQTQTSVTITVSLDPLFDFPPTPNTLIVREPGSNMNFTVQAHDPDTNDNVTINKLEGRNNSGSVVPISNSLYNGVSFSLPTTLGNPTSGVFSWTPDNPSWGMRNLIFTAEDTYGDKATHEVSVIVNTTPTILSTAPNTACVGNQFVYNFMAQDTDMVYGDYLELHDVNLPSWLTFVDNGDGTGSLTGTPTISDTGTYSFSIHVEDSFHHVNVGGAPEQDITLQVMVCGNCGGLPASANVHTGNVVINTQTQLDQFLGNNNDANQGKVFTQVDGNLTLNGDDANDPITDLCNLRGLVDVTGYFHINSFNKNGNPTDLSDLALLRTIGGGFKITGCSEFLFAYLYSLQTVGGEISVQANVNLKALVMDSLKSVASTLSVRNNHRIEKMYFSRSASSFNFTGNKNYLNIFNNGRQSANPLVIDLKKVTTINGNMQFSNNDNTGVSNLDDILTNLSSISGSMSVNNNQYLAQCCVAVNCTVGNKRNVRNNTGNCKDLNTAQNACTNLNNKRGGRPLMVNDDMFTDLSINPSPNNGTFELYVNTLQEGTINITVTDMLGREVYQTSKDVQEDVYIPINMYNASEGQYILKAELNGKVQIRRLMISNK